MLKDKIVAFSLFQMFHKMIQTQFIASIKIFYYDNEVIILGDLGTYFREHDIIHQTTCQYYQIESVAKLKNRQILKVTRYLTH